MDDPQNAKRRRALYLLLGFAAFAAASRGAFRLGDRLNAGFDFVEMESPEGFRKLQLWEQSVYFDPLIRLDAGLDSFPATDI